MGLTLGATAAGLDLQAAAPVPRRAPELAVMLNGNQQLLLSKYRGKLVALEFLLTTCSHCQRCSGIVEMMYRSSGRADSSPSVRRSTITPRRWSPSSTASSA